MDQEAARIWRDPESPAICLLTLGIDRHPETDGGRLLCLNWLPQTWSEEILQETGEPPCQRAMHRLGAALGLMNNPDEYYRSVPGFRDVCSGLASDWFDTGVDHHLTTDELLRGVVEAYMIHPPEEGEEFSPAVMRYVSMTAREEGFSKLPDAFKAFGIRPDRSVDWGADLSPDPELSDLAMAGDKDRQQELVDSLNSFLLETADRLEQLPLRTIKNAKAVADDIRRRVPSIPSE